MNDRYRNFRIFTTPSSVQFSCLAIDSTDEFVAAGAQDVFHIYVWSIKLGHLIEVRFTEYLILYLFYKLKCHEN